MQPPPQRWPKRKNAVWRLYDAPIYRDWAFWATAFFTVTSPWAIIDAPENQNKGIAALLLAALLATILIVGLFAVFPALVRLWVRRWRWSRMQRRIEPGHRQASHMMAQGADTSTPGVVMRAPSTDVQASAGAQVAASAEAPTKPPTEQLVPAPRLATIRSGAHLESEVLEQARSGMPYPVARSIRIIQLAEDPKELYESVLRGAEALSLVLGITTVSWCLERSSVTQQIRQLQSALMNRGVSLGLWHAAAQSAAEVAGKSPGSWPNMSESFRRGRGGSGLSADLALLVRERNNWAHGGAPRNKEEASQRIAPLLGAFERAVSATHFLTEAAWALIQRTTYRRREGDFEIKAQRVMGDHPDFSAITMVARNPFGEDCIYAMTPTGAVDLTPLVVPRFCPTCQQRELYHADRLDEANGLILKSFERGHVLISRDLDDERPRYLDEDVR